MKSPKKSKHHFINEIINIIKKYNISIEDIIKEYIYKYESNFIKYSKEDFLKNKPSVFWFNKYQIIDDYVLI
jgi:hypothetical protein